MPFGSQQASENTYSTPPVSNVGFLIHRVCHFHWITFAQALVLRSRINPVTTSELTTLRSYLDKIQANSPSMAGVLHTPHRQWRIMETRGSVDHDDHTLMVKNVPRHLSESEVRDILMSNPLDGVWACNSNGRRNKVTNAAEPIEGQFFVNFVSADLAREALLKWNGQVIGENQICVEFKTLRSGQPQTRPSQQDEALWGMRVNEWERTNSQTVAQVSGIFPIYFNLQREAPAQFRASAPEFIPGSQVQVSIKSSTTASSSSFPSTGLFSAFAAPRPGRFTVPLSTLPPQDVMGKRSKSFGDQANSTNIVAPIPRHGREEIHEILRKAKTFPADVSISKITHTPGMPAIWQPQDLELTWKRFEYSVLGGEKPHVDRRSPPVFFFPSFLMD